MLVYTKKKNKQIKKKQEKEEKNLLNIEVAQRRFLTRKDASRIRATPNPLELNIE